MADWLTWEGDLPGQGGALTADAVTAIQANGESEVTKHPIESGSVIADHIIHQPDALIVDFVQSNKPLENEEHTDWQQVTINPRPSAFSPSGLLALTMAVGAAVEAVASAIGLAGGGGPQVYMLTANDDTDYINELHDKLLDVRSNGYLCTFQRAGLVRTGLVITSVQLSRTSGEAGLARFTIRLESIATVETAAASLVGDVVGAVGAAALSAVPILDQGSRSVDEIAEDVVDKSLLVQSGLPDALGL